MAFCFRLSEKFLSVLKSSAGFSKCELERLAVRVGAMMRKASSLGVGDIRSVCREASYKDSGQVCWLGSFA